MSAWIFPFFGGRGPRMPSASVHQLEIQLLLRMLNRNDDSFIDMCLGYAIRACLLARFELRRHLLMLAGGEGRAFCSLSRRVFKEVRGYAIRACLLARFELRRHLLMLAGVKAGRSARSVVSNSIMCFRRAFHMRVVLAVIADEGFLGFS